MNLDSLPNFNEVSDEKVFTEKFIKIDQVLDKPIAVLDYCNRSIKGKQGNTVDKVHILVEIENKRWVVSTASAVLARQIQNVKALPFKAKISRPNKCYTFLGV